MVAAAKPRHRRYTPDEYLEIERAAELKSEYLDGQIYAMAGGSPEHNTISINLTVEVGGALRSGPCRPFGSDQKVRIPSEALFTYPDLSVVCGEPRYHDSYGDVLLNPAAIFEVLSPSTEDYDRGRKFTRYQQIESLSDYILIAQDQPRIDHYVRQTPDRWLLTTYVGLETMFQIPSIGCALRLSDVYNRIEFRENGEGDEVA
jgi:Uma2 family endonuclease